MGKPGKVVTLVFPQGIGDFNHQGILTEVYRLADLELIWRTNANAGRLSVHPHFGSFKYFAKVKGNMLDLAGPLEIHLILG